MAHQFLPVLLVFGVAVLTAAAMLGMAAMMGTRARQRSAVKYQTYETGMPLLDRSVKRIPVKFYLVALVFVVLDVEVAFLYPWAVSYRGALAEGSTVVLWDMLVFLAPMATVYLYLWRKGVFDWGRRTGVPPRVLGEDNDTGNASPPRAEGEPGSRGTGV